MTFAKLLQELRGKAGLSQNQLADASGVPVWSLRGYEQGKRDPQWDVLFKLAQPLGVTCEAFKDCVPNGSSKSAAKPSGKKPAKKK